MMTASERVPVSIVIPCYNTEKFIGATIQSALDQTVPVSEIIIVDDGSTDSSPAIIQRYADAHPDIIRVIRQANAGVASARTEGVRAARHNDVLPLDADDLLHPEGVEKAYTYGLAHPEFAVIYGDYYNMSHDGEILDLVSIGARRIDPLEGNILPTILWENVASAIAFVRRDKVLSVGGYFVETIGKKIDTFADVFLYMRMLVAGFQLGYMKQPLFYYRNLPNSMSKDPAHVHSAMRIALAYMFKNAPDQMADAFYTMRQWRDEQLRDAFESITAKDAQNADLLAEIERARHYQQEQETVVAARDATITQYLGEIDTARATIEELRAAIATQEQKYLGEIDTARTTIEELRAAITTQEQKYLAEIEQARAFQENLQATIGNHEAKIAECLHEIDTARDFQEKLQATIVVQQAKIAECLREIEHARDFQGKLQATIAARDASLAQYLAEIEAARSVQANQQTAITAHEAKIAEYLGEIERARQFQDDLQESITAQEAAITHYVNEVDQMRATQTRLQTTVTATEAKIAAMQETNATLTGRLGQREQTIVSLQTTLNRERAALEQAERAERPSPFGNHLKHRLELRDKLIQTLNDALTRAQQELMETTGNKNGPES
jgi:GT2 family glycosyltransferase